MADPQIQANPATRWEPVVMTDPLRSTTMTEGEAWVAVHHESSRRAEGITYEHVPVDVDGLTMYVEDRTRPIAPAPAVWPAPNATSPRGFSAHAEAMLTETLKRPPVVSVLLEPDSLTL